MKSQNTNCVHLLKRKESTLKGVTSAIFPSTAYGYSDDLVYPGFSSTYNQKRLGEIMAQLEDGKWGMAFSNGMSAISAAILSLVKAGEHIIFFNELYGGTWKFAKQELPLRGIECSFAKNHIDSFKSCLRENSKLVYLETPSNPLMTILNLEEIAAWAKENNLITLVDNTFATPINQKPLQLGIDISLHSGTKYLGGHNDLPFGAAVGNNPELYNSILSTSKLYGGSLTPQSCYLAERSIKTLALRVERQNENAMKIAQFLANHPKINKVYYPGLDSHDNYQIARQQMAGYGGMLSFEIKSDSIEGFLSNLKIISPALSLGGVESLICSPALTSHIGLTREERNEMGISDNLLRLSVGIEDSEDLIEDLNFSLSNVNV